MNIYGNSSEASSDLAAGGEIGGDLDIIGNLSVTDTISTETLIAETIVSEIVVEDSLIHLAKDNPADNLNIGWYGEYVQGAKRYSGLIRSKDDQKFYLMNDNITLPTGTSAVNSNGNLKLSNLETTQITINDDYALPLLGGSVGEVMKIVAGGDLEFGDLYDQNLNMSSAVEFSNLSFDKPGEPAIREIAFKVMGVDQLKIRHTDGNLIIRSALNPIIKFNSNTNKIVVGNNAFTIPNVLGNSGQVLTVPASGTDLEFKDVPTYTPPQELGVISNPTFNSLTLGIPGNDYTFESQRGVNGQVLASDGIGGCNFINIPPYIPPQGLGTGDSPTFSGLTIGTNPTNYFMPSTRGSNGQILISDAVGNLAFGNQADISEFIPLSGTADINNILKFNASGEAVSSEVTIAGGVLDKIDEIKDMVGNSYISSNGTSTVVENTTDIRLKINGNLNQFLNASGNEMYKPIQLITSTADNEISFGSVPSYHILSKTGDNSLYIQQIVAGVPDNAMKFSASPVKQIDLDFTTQINKPLIVSEASNAKVTIQSTTNGDASLILNKKLIADEANIIFQENSNTRFTISQDALELKIQSQSNDLLTFDSDTVRTGPANAFIAHDLRITNNYNPISFHQIQDNAGHLELTDLNQNQIVRIGPNNVELKKPTECDYGVCQYKQFFGGMGICTPAQMYWGYGNVTVAAQIYTSLLSHGDTLGTLTIPANALSSGAHLKFKCGGYIYNNNQNMDIQFKLQGIVIGSILDHNPEGQTKNNGFELECDIGFKVTGTSYECITVGELTYSTTTDNKDRWEGQSQFNLNPVTGLNAAAASLFEVVFKWQGTGATICNQLTEVSFSTVKYL